MKSINLFLLLVLIAEITGHAYVTSPPTRSNQGQSQVGCRMDSLTAGCTGPCDNLSGGGTAPIATSRGATLNVRWARNNHPGGFIRWAWAPVSTLTHTEFDDRVQFFECFEKGSAQCAPGDPNDANQGDGPATTQTSCGSTFTVPDYLGDGTWALQWAWFGGGFALGDYYSCIYYTVSGGNAYTATIPAPTFIGGDYANPGLPQCRYWNTNGLHYAIVEPASSPANTFTRIPGPANGAPVNHKRASSTPPSTPPAGTPSTPPPATPPATPTPTPTPVTPTPVTPTPVTPTPVTPVPVTPTPSDTGSSVQSGSVDGSGEQLIPCAANADCASGVCQLNGYCLPKQSSGLDAGSIAAIAIAMVFLVLVIAAVLFLVANKGEWRNWKPFNR